VTIEQIPAALDGERIDRVVSLLAGCSRAEAAALLAAGSVLIGGVATTKPSTRVHAGDEVSVTAQPVASEPVVLADAAVAVVVVHEDPDVIVVDKPAGLVVHPGSGNRSGTLVHGLVALYPEIAAVGEPDRPGVVHRLDKDTSGLLVIARTADAHRELVRQLASRAVTRRYLALVWGQPEATTGLIDAPIGRSGREPTRMAVSARGREARTRYEVVATYAEPAPTALLRCQLETGRTHQIRVHLAAIEHPLVGDARYGGRHEPLADVPRFFLHAEHLGFIHPRTGEALHFDSALPADLESVLDRLA
jgi:23S rRNA pseudouridine1911/1915/1917 synthase